MELVQLRAFLVAAEELHFGRAALALEILPAVLGRRIQQLESELRVRLFTRSTRKVELTGAGKRLLPMARKLLKDADTIIDDLRALSRTNPAPLRVGVIDSAAIGLIPGLLRDLHESYPDIEIALVEGKTIRLLPQLLAGTLDLAFVRPPERFDRRLQSKMLLEEHPILALPSNHPLTSKATIPMADLEGIPMILPIRRSRPHSHDLAVKVFEHAGVPMSVAQEADEKHTILRLVSAGIGAAIVPRWNALAAEQGISFRTIEGADTGFALPLAGMWLTDVNDPRIEKIMEILDLNIETYAAVA